MSTQWVCALAYTVLGHIKQTKCVSRVSVQLDRGEILGKLRKPCKHRQPTQTSANHANLGKPHKPWQTTQTSAFPELVKSLPFSVHAQSNCKQNKNTLSWFFCECWHSCTTSGGETRASIRPLTFKMCSLTACPESHNLSVMGPFHKAAIMPKGIMKVCRESPNYVWASSLISLLRGTLWTKMNNMGFFHASISNAALSLGQSSIYFMSVVI